MQVASLHSYPVKGCHRIDHAEARVEPWGLAGDRRWMIVDPSGIGITQRDQPVLTSLTVVTDAGGLELRAPGRSPISVDEPADGEIVEVRVFSDKPPVRARVAAGAGEWVSGLFGGRGRRPAHAASLPARLVWLDDSIRTPATSASSHCAYSGNIVAFPAALSSA